MADVHGITEKSDPAPVVGIAVLHAGLEKRDLRGRHIEEIVSESVSIPRIVQGLFGDLAVIGLRIKGFLSGDIVPGRIHFVPLAVQLHQIPGVRAGSLFVVSGSACDDSTSDSRFLQKILIGVGVAVADSAVLLAPAVGHQSAVGGVCQILVAAGCGFFVVGDQIDELVVDLQRHSRSAFFQIDLREEGVCGIIESLQLRVPVREGSDELEGNVVSALVEELAPVGVLERVVTHIEPEKLGMVEKKSVVAAVERGLEFVARGVGADLEFSALFGGIVGEGTGEERIIQKLFLRGQIRPAVMDRVIFRGSDPLRGLRIGKQHGCCQQGNDPCGCDG